MCGIFCVVKHGTPSYISSNAKSLLEYRGPDSLQSVVVTWPLAPLTNGVSPRQLHVSLSASVLSLRGDAVVSQPIRDNESGSVFCWNGEAWLIDGHRVSGNDTENVFRTLLNASISCAGFEEAHESVLDAVSRIRGPFAFTFFDAPHAKLYFGRDRLGRRSLLKTTTVERSLILASVADLTLAKTWSEIEADGIYVADLQGALGASVPSDVPLQCFPYTLAGELTSNSQTAPFPIINKNVPTTLVPSLNLHSDAVAQLQTCLRSSLELRIKRIRNPSHGAGTVQIAILFSGGLDCALLTRLAHDLLPPEEPIDLLNVAFQNPRIHTDPQAAPYEVCPDRITARATHAELEETCAGRKFRLVLVNVPYTETSAHRQTIIDLIHPHNTEMDFSIACALYFASRGIGIDSSTGEEYQTSARVLLSGLGADELFGGYQRHATAFQRAGYPGLIAELELDFNRLGKRNLGRDDRVISHWGKEARYPYLDEDLVAWALKLPVWEKCGFRLDTEFIEETCSRDASVDACGTAELEPGKRLLRLLAWKLGMHRLAKEKKRAIQFGARTAKMQTSKTKGTQLLS